MAAGDLKVNFSQEEAASEARSFEPVPSGNYHVRFTDGSWEECGPQSKNPGKPYVRVEMTIQSGPYQGQKLFTNVMLFEGALYSFVQIAKATGNEDWVSKGRIPGNLLELLEGKEVSVYVKKQVDKYQIDKAKEDGITLQETPYKNEVKSFSSLDKSSAGKAPAGAGKASRLP